MTKILIAEDENIVALNIRKTLEALGYHVSSVVKRGEDAIRQVEKDKPDLILMDIMLKGLTDGIEAAEIITKNFNIPIIFLTALSDEKTIDRAAFTKPYGYLLKPFTNYEMHTAIENALLNFEETVKNN